MRRLATPEEAAALLVGGGVLLMPTDTIPGLHGRAGDEAAARRIAILKGRGSRQPFLLLCTDAGAALALCDDPDGRVKLYFSACWPGPFTFIVKAGPGVPAAALAGAGTVAVRVPEPAWLRRLIGLVGAPLMSTSANPAGSPAPVDLAGAESWASGGVDGVYAPSQAEVGPPGSSGASRASALVDLTARPARLLREGPRPLPPEALAAEGGNPGGAVT